MTPHGLEPYTMSWTLRHACTRTLPWRLVQSSSKQAYQTGADSVVLLVKSFVSIGSIFRDNHGFDA